MSADQTRHRVDNLFDDDTGAKPVLESLHTQVLPRPLSRTPSSPILPLDEEEQLLAPSVAEQPTYNIPEPASSPEDLIRQNLSVKTPVENDPDRYTLDLPSGLYFYSPPSISCALPKAKHQSKFHRAAKEERTRHLVDAVSSLLDPGFSAWSMSYPDFVWTLYWLRLNGYTKQTLVHHGICDNPQHIKQVVQGLKDEKTLISLHTISKTTLKETLLDMGAVTKFLQDNFEELSFLAESNYRLHIQTMKDIVELEEDYASKPEFAEIEYLADFAGCLTHKDGIHVPLEERLAFVDGLTPDQLDLLTQYRNLVSSYGVIETIKFTCPECRAVVESQVSMSAHSFL